MSSNRIQTTFNRHRQNHSDVQNTSSALISRAAVNSNGETLVIRASSNGTMEGVSAYLRSICQLMMLDNDLDCDSPTVEHDSGDGGCAPCSPPITQYSQAQLLSCNGLTSRTYQASLACGSEQIQQACALPTVDSCNEPEPDANPPSNSSSTMDAIHQGGIIAGSAIAFLFLLCCIRYLCRRARHPEDFQELPASPRHRP